MSSDKIRPFITENHCGVLTTFRKNGAAQMSIISCGYFREGVAFTTAHDNAKFANLKHNPSCSLLVAQPNWWGYVVLEGHAQLLSAENIDPEELRLALRDVYQAAGGGEHSDWEEYDQAMHREGRAIVIVVPERIYGTAV